jgi:hypothetical protein
MSGWIKLHRKIWDWPYASDKDFLVVWIYLLTHAAHESRSVLFNGQRIMLNPGQLVAGRKQIAEKTGVTQSKVQRVLKRLESEQQIEQQANNRSRLISLAGWHLYQESEQPYGQPVNIQRTTDEQPVNTYKERKKKKNGKKEKEGYYVPKEKAAPSSLDVEFESFWEGCQKRVAKPAAKKAWMKMRKENRTDLSGDELLAKYNALVESVMAERGTKEFVPHPSTWINQDRWDDEEATQGAEGKPAAIEAKHAEPADWKEIIRHGGKHHYFDRHKVEQLEETYGSWDNIPANEQRILILEMNRWKNDPYNPDREKYVATA